MISTSEDYNKEEQIKIKFEKKKKEEKKKKVNM